MLLLSAAVLTTTGCTEAVDPVIGTERAFTVYGFFNARADTQAMRIFAIEGQLELTRPEPLDAMVTSVELRGGRQQAWQDSVVQFVNGRYGHIYWSTFRPDFEQTYRLQITRSDGAVTHVEVTVPPLSEPVLLTPTVAERFVFLPVLWQRAPRVNNIRVRYHTNCGAFTFGYPLDQEQVDVGTIVTVELSNDAREIFGQILNSECTVPALRLEEIELLVLVSNAEWVPPTGVFDPELLVEPGTFSNVENGFGFVGGGYPASFRWDPPDSVVTAAGFLVGDEEDG